jgi:hypothetical protein
VLTVAAVMVAMVLALVVPAFADPGNGNGATVLPHDCFPHMANGSNYTDCVHSTVTPSGNFNLSNHLKPNS